MKCIDPVKKLTAFAEKFNMLPRGTKVLAAVSGGADSVCLLYMLTELSQTLGISVIAAHFNHSLRGAESDRDEAFTENVCKTLGVPFISERGDVRSYAEENGLGTEEAARILRYAFLERARLTLDADKIATAHNQDDNAETVIMNLVRGAGEAGVAGIPPVRGNIIRPLLCLTRTEIEAYLRDKKAEFVTDSSNLTDDYARNKIRHRVMPVLREINPQMSEHFLNTSLICRENEEYLCSGAAEFVEKYAPDGAAEAEKILALEHVTACRVIRLMAGKNITNVQTEAVLSLLKSGKKTGRVDLTGISAFLSQGILTFEKKISDVFCEKELIPGKTLELGDLGISISFEKTVFDDNINKSFTDYLFKTSEVYGKIIVRSRNTGDRIRLRGTACTKTLKKLYNEKHIPEHKRASVPVIADDQGVLAVYGVGCSARGAPSAGDIVYRITIKEINKNDQ